MALLVLKFGGSSVATSTRIKNVSEIIARLKSENNRVVVVTSAMQGTTDHLIELTKPFSSSSFNREYDAVISSGEQIAAGLLAMSLNSIGVPAKSFSAWQIPIKSTSDHSDAEILEVNREKILNEVNGGIVPVITGFQGISSDESICTIGRGGSDATACAIANSIQADECLIYTDVDGVYTADPRIVLNAKKISEISYDDMIALATWGAKVLQTKSTLIAKKYNVNLKVLSSFSNEQGTKVTSKTHFVSNNTITGIAHNLNLSILKLLDLSATDFIKPFIYKELPEQISSFLVCKNLQSEILSILENAKIKFEIDNDVGIATVIGEFSDPAQKELYLREITSLLDENNITVKTTISSDNSISCLVPFAETERVVNLLHGKFFE